MTLALKAARRLGVVVLAVFSVLFFTQSPAQAAYYFELTNGNSLKCLAIPGGDPINGVNPIQWTCNNGDEQRWELRSEANNRVRLVNKQTGKCLVVASIQTGSKPFQFNCDWETPPSETDLWIHDSANRLRSMYADLCLAVPNSSLTNGVKPILWTCSTNDDQVWF